MNVLYEGGAAGLCAGLGGLSTRLDYHRGRWLGKQQRGTVSVSASDAAYTTDPDFDDDGLIPAVCQDADTGEVLTLAYMNREALRLTRESGDVWFWSRSRQELWHKGATSGNFLRVTAITIDCDKDSLLVKVRPTGPACHTGSRSCFFREL